MAVSSTIINKLKKLWNIWNLRGFITLSLSLQILLVLFSSSRQRWKNSLFISLVWTAYLLADWVAAFAIGLITQIEDNDAIKTHNQEIYAFWAAFLLVHLGGPDAITSFALEDNEFWIRHLFGLIVQAAAAGYAFYLTPSGNKLWPCTVLIFFAGVVKYGERTRALYLASIDQFGRTALPKPEPGIDYEQASSIYSSNLVEASLEGEITSDRPRRMGNPYFELDRITSNVSVEIRKLRVARLLFERFKGLIVGFFLDFDDRKSSREYFLKTDYKSAFRVLEYELSFMFQVLHTKMVVVNQRIGYIFRLFSFLTTLIAALYFLLVEKHNFGRLEIILTYALLLSAIALEIISVTVLVCSDWTLVLLKNKWTKYVPSFILKRQRWSRLISQYNMISYCLDEHPTWFYQVAKYVHVEEILDYMKISWYSSSYEVHEDLQEFIFVNLQKKSEEAFSLRDAREACQQRGDSALLESTIKRNVAGYLKLKWSVGDFKFAESVLLWHIATEICCLDEKIRSKSEIKRKRYCEIVSDYMFYLLVAQPTMLSTVLGDWHVTFQDTCAEGKRFFEKYSILDHSKAVERMKSTKAKFRSAAVKGSKSKSLFFDACMLAQQLLNIEDEKWNIMDRVWLEFMSYAAINCRPVVHAQQPSRGGELLTFTWLLMNHLGLGMQFSEQEDRPGMKRAAVK